MLFCSMPRFTSASKGLGAGCWSRRKRIVSAAVAVTPLRFLADAPRSPLTLDARAWAIGTSC